MLINTNGQPMDPHAPLGPCAICGQPAWTTTRAGLLCELHDTPETQIIHAASQAFGCDLVSAVLAYVADEGYDPWDDIFDEFGS